MRDRDGDIAKTQAMWVDTLDRMKAAGMNLVSTYIPWDYHELSPGQFDFTGIRDISKFFELACERGFKVVAKPGPLITGEWPGGFGTFGAVPTWWKTANVDALARKSDGSLYSYSPTGATSQRQPTLLHPAYLAAVTNWYDHVLPFLQPFSQRCLVAIQVDNETNLFWSGRYGDADYSQVALTHWRSWLANRYGTIAALNTAWHTTYTTFAEAMPPGSAPGNASSERAKNRWYADWYEGGLAFVGDYLRSLKQLMVTRGFGPPNQLFFTNDSPFPLLGPENVLLHDALLHDGATKNAIGLAGLDLYPKQLPSNSALQDQPFQADYFTRLYDFFGDIATGPQEFAWAAELQGGFYSYPVVGHPTVSAPATDQLMARSVGRGMKGGSFYVIRDGLNADNSSYDYLAGLSADGTPTPRFDVMARWGRLLNTHGTTLLAAHEVTDSVVLLADRRHAIPQGGIFDSMQRLAGVEYPGVFGWLANAGFNPVVMEASRVTAADLAPYKAVVYLNPDFQDDATATTLADYVAGGGTLVNFLWPGRSDDQFHPSAAATRYAAMFPATQHGDWSWVGVSRSGSVNGRFGTFSDTVISWWYESFWQPTATVTPFLWERHAITGTDGDVVGYSVDDSAGKRVFIGTYVSTPFSNAGYYTLADADLTALRSLARHVLGIAGVSPRLRTTGNRQLAWARRAGPRVYLFLINDNASSVSMHVSFAELQAFGLDAATTYSARDALTLVSLPSVTGASLAAQGLTVQVAALGTAVVVLDQ